jgi:hypothetical protein
MKYTPTRKALNNFRSMFRNIKWKDGRLSKKDEIYASGYIK